MNKEKYEKPKSIIENFEIFQVITTSYDVREDDNEVEWGS